MKINRRNFLTLTGTAGLGLTTRVSADSGKREYDLKHPDHFSFVAIGDRTGRERKGVYGEVMRKINLLNPSLVVSVGDSIEGYTKKVDSIHAQWDEFEELTSVLRMPLLKAVGNHDMTNETMAEIFKERYGPSYHHYVYKDTLFLFINTEDPTAKEPIETRQKWDKVAAGTFVESARDEELIALKSKLRADGYTDLAGIEDYNQQSRDFRSTQISDEQVQYFKEVLAQNDEVRWTFVIMHKRAYLQTTPPKNWLAIEEMLSDRPYTVFSGHEHRYSHIVRHGRDYINMPPVGGGKKYPPEVLPGIYDGVLMVHVTDGKPIIGVVAMAGFYDKNKAESVHVIPEGESKRIKFRQ